jgi:hypothetical protein
MIAFSGSPARQFHLAFSPSLPAVTGIEAMIVAAEASLRRHRP